MENNQIKKVKATITATKFFCWLLIICGILGGIIIPIWEWSNLMFPITLIGEITNIGSFAMGIYFLIQIKKLAKDISNSYSIWEMNFGIKIVCPFFILSGVLSLITGIIAPKMNDLSFGSVLFTVGVITCIKLKHILKHEKSKENEQNK